MRIDSINEPDPIRDEQEVSGRKGDENMPPVALTDSSTKKENLHALSTWSYAPIPRSITRRAAQRGLHLAQSLSSEIDHLNLNKCLALSPEMMEEMEHDAEGEYSCQ